MTTILVPVINESPNTISVTFQSDYAVSFEAANPDGVPADCQVGGPGVLGGPEYVNLLQRTNTSIGQTGYACEQFELPQYPLHTFYSFNNFTTGAKNVVAFLKSAAPTPDATPVVGVITGDAAGATGATLAGSVTAVANAVSYAWTGTAIASITTGANTNSITYVAAGTTGAKTLICTVTTETGIAVASTTKTVTLS